MVQRSLPFLVLAGLLSCKGDPTGDLRNGVDHLKAAPSSIFVTSGTSKFVVVTAVDEQGNTVTAKFAAPQASAGITVVRDSSYLPVYDDKGNLTLPAEVTSARYIVTATSATANSNFSVSAGGKDVTVPVRILPATTAGIVTASTATPANGDTVALTLAAPYKYTSGSVATIGGTAVYKVSVSTDSSTMRIVPSPAATGTVSITNVVLGYAPAAASFTGTSTGTVTAPAIPNLTLNKNAAAVGDTIIVTAPARFKFTPASTPTVTGAGLAVVSRSADSTQIRFLIGPSANAVVSVNNLRVAGALTLGPFTAASAAAVTTPPVSAQTVTLSTATPNINQNVTLTAPAGFKLLPSAKVFFGNAQQHVVSVAADSNSLVFRATAAGASGAISVGNAALSFLTSVPIVMPTTNTATVGATINSLAGTDALATAPGVTIPDAGKTFTLRDAGAFAVGPAVCSASLGGPCRIYKYTISAARTYTVSASWQGTTDIGVYWATSAGALITTPAAFLNCDAKGAGAGGQPETCTITAQAAGTYFLIVDSFAPFYPAPNNVDPTDFTVTITGQ